MELAAPLWLALLPLVMAWILWPRGRRRQPSGQTRVLIHPNLEAAGSGPGPLGSRLPWLMTGLGWALLVLALAQPRQVGDWITPPPEGRDIMLVIDTSRTMSIDDFEMAGQKADRMAVLKSVMGRFIQARAGDRFGVIAFGTSAASLTPPTFDHEHAIAQLRRIQVGMAGDNTALGDALGLAVRQVRQGRLRPAVILVSDGEPSNSGDLTPAEAVAVARASGVAVHTVQIGSDLFAAGRRNPAPEAEPQPDLADISRLTGGRHWVIKGTADARQVIADIGRLEATLPRPARFRQTREWYWLALALAAASLTLAHLAPAWPRPATREPAP